MSFLTENKTKILGYLIAAAGFISTTIAAGTFKDLLEPTTVAWLGIGCGFVISVFGAGAVIAGHSNTTRERVAASAAEVVVAKADIAVAQAETASAMESAINATPGGK